MRQSVGISWASSKRASPIYVSVLLVVQLVKKPVYLKERVSYYCLSEVERQCFREISQNAFWTWYA